MLPAYYLRLDRIPLTTNGKVNRQALPRPLARPRVLRHDYLAPVTSTEKAVTEIWRQVLKMQQIGTDDNFFALGGESLPAALLLFKIEQRFGALISISEFARMPTVGQLAAHLEHATGSDKPE